ncbi:hypothetical protein [Streptomyces sp. NPDC021020]|uniref:hypothetical protein n=1 Tax=Streptomyces sp. NPDC021020 TaxID=3365109 RepID=UPI0037AB03A6
MSWPTVIILAPTGRRPMLEERFRSFELEPEPPTGDERIYWQGYSYSVDLSGGILAEYESDELELVTTRIGEPYGVCVSCESMDAARALLRHVLDGFDGLIDTNHGEILWADEFLALLDEHPAWDWRRQPSAALR